MVRALITGITRQDISYPADLLLSKEYDVHGVVRQPAPLDTFRIDHLVWGSRTAGAPFSLHYMDLTDADCLDVLFAAVQPDEVYHLSAPSHVRGTVDDPDYVDDISGVDTTRMLEAVRRLDRECRFCQASSTEMYAVTSEPRDERPPFQPRSVYGAAKVYSHWITTIYRESHGAYAVNGVLYDHDSPRRAEAYVTRRITRAAARISAGSTERLELRDIDTPSDLGYAKDYVDAVWRMLQADVATDYVVATGTSTTLRELAGHAFGALGLDWRDHVTVAWSPGAAVLGALVGDTSKAEAVLGWTSSTTARELAELMVEADLDLLTAEVRA